MSPRLAWIVLLSVTACSAQPERSEATRTAGAAQETEPTSTPGSASFLPPEACSREGYEAFVEAFVRNPQARPSLALRGAPVEKLDIAMRDYGWVLASHPDTLLDVEEHRQGDELAVTARPVERNDEDEVVNVLGPTRTYTFRFEGGCWKFAAIR